MARNPHDRATTGANGAYAVAAPAFAHTPVLSGDSIENGKRDRLFSIQSASAAGVHELYAAPHKRPGSATGLAAPDTHRPDCPERD